MILSYDQREYFNRFKQEAALILVIGANGRVGQNVVTELVKHHNTRPRIMVRDLPKAISRFHDSVSSSVEIVAGDLIQVESIEAAMKGISAVFLCSPVHPEQVTHHLNVVEAAVREGAYIVKLSGLATFPGSFVDSGDWHSQTEELIRQTGLDYTFLHPFFFSQNLAMQLKSANEHGVIRSSVSEAPIAMVDVRDIAAVAAALLAQPDLAPQKTLTLTQTSALTYTEIASVFGEVLKRPVKFQAQTLSQTEKLLRASGQPDWHVKILLQFTKAFNEGLGSTPSDSIHAVLGKAPLTLRETLESAIKSQRIEAK